MTTKKTDLEKLLHFAKRITEEAGDYVIDVLKEEEIKVKRKSSASDLVTQVDHEVERRLIACIREEYPQHCIIGEEGLSEDQYTGEYRWIIDPIDGTTNFVHQQINFCISVAMYHHHEALIGVILDPVRKECFWAAKGMGAFLNDTPIHVTSSNILAESLVGTNLVWVGRTQKWGMESQVRSLAQACRGIRSLGAAALELAYLAAGRLDAFLSLHLAPWDFAAGKLIVEEAGGSVTDFDGAEIQISDEKFGLLATNRVIHSKLLDVLKKT